MQIVVIGGGPIGCYTAYLLAKTGHNVTVYENHGQIGAPIQCTGILTSSFDEFSIPVDSFLVNTIDKIDVYSPNASLSVNQKDYVVCRNKFDNYFADLARKEGAVIKVNHSFTRKEGKELVITDSVHKREIRVSPDIVIGADGPLSPTAKAYGFYHKDRQNYFGVQATVEGNFEQGTIKTYFGNEVCPGLFAWVCPESSTRARVGLATTKNSKAYFDTFMKEHGFTAVEMQAGTIPIYHPKQKLQQDNCYLVGDASGYVKATTLGGLVPAMKQAEVLVDCINSGKNYQKALRPVRRQLWSHLQAHKVFNKFSDTDWDDLVTYVSKPKVQGLFEKYTRDNPLPIMSRILFKEPRFMKFVKHVV